VVMKRGTATVSPQELADAITTDHDTTVEPPRSVRETPERRARRSARARRARVAPRK